MEFWHQLSSKTRILLIGILSFIFIGSSFLLYPRFLKNSGLRSEEEIVLPAELKEVTVYVTGAVRKPGVYAITKGSRIKDALLKAGGTTEDWDPEGINLAKLLDDEDMVVVPKKTSGTSEDRQKAFGTKKSFAKKKLSPTQTTSLNQASTSELETLPGVGPGVAKRILDYRKMHGSFQSVDDIKNVPGIGQKKAQKLKPYLRL